MSAPLNFQNLFEIDINPGGTANYKRLGDGLTSATPKTGEKVDQKTYLDDDGGQTSEVTGFQLVYSFSGDRIPGDPAQDYIFSKLLDIGAARHTNFRATDAGGTIISGEATIANITPPGGEAGSASAISFELHLNGKPTKTDPVPAPALTMTIASSLVTSGCTKVTATPGAGNSLAYRLTSQALTVKSRQYVDQFTAYTSGADIPAAVGQYLNVYEIDAYKHVVKFASQVLASGDIKE